MKTLKITESLIKASLHRSDFVQQNRTNHKLTNMMFQTQTSNVDYHLKTYYFHLKSRAHIIWKSTAFHACLKITFEMKAEGWLGFLSHSLHTSCNLNVSNSHAWTVSFEWMYSCSNATP
jgi:hypothetical protein